MKENKRKVLVPLLIIAVLAAAFYFGGSAPGSQGWQVRDNAPPVSTTPEAPEETPSSEPSVPASPVPSEGTPSAEELPTESPDTPTDTEPAPPLKTEEDPAMEINPETGKDAYQTDPVPDGKPFPVEPQDAVISATAHTCTISINCAVILDNLDYCDPEKKELVPEDGWILEPITVTFYEGESVFNVLQRTCKQQKIHMEYEDTPIYNSAYIEGIHNLYEFDVGELSGWMYKVNDWFPNYGCSRYQLKDGDTICWVYTCDLGTDVGGSHATGNIRP